ncbi:MAG: ScpA family protein [Cyanobacteriota bacterium]|nr:ScpA family protein [Cyanobacteriota bacterium]
MNNTIINGENINNTVYEGLSSYDQNEGIGILVKMVQSGEIDPWNIDIVDVTDRYLQKMTEMKSLDLKVASRTFLFAAILCRLQSNVLAGLTLEEFQDNDEPEMMYDDDGLPVDDYNSQDYIPTNNVVRWDEALKRRTSIRMNRKRVVTLKDLIKQLEFYEKLEQRVNLKDAQKRARNRVRDFSRLTTHEIISNMSHDAYIEQAVLKLKDNIEQIFQNEDKIELDNLKILGMDRVTSYMALLFLSRDTDYELEQEEFYSDLYVVKGGGNAYATA